MSKIPLLVICGPTASGKTAVGAELARRLDGEVISADSMQIYKNMDIVTAVPSYEERLGVPHHLMGMIDPGTPFSAADYAELASKTAQDIFSRGKLPVIVGGTGLYISALADGISFDKKAADSSVRERLCREADEHGAEYMLEKLRTVDPKAAQRLHPNNIVRVIRALEMFETTGRTFDENMRLSKAEGSPYKLCMIGLNFKERADLYDRINQRVTLMAENGMVEQAHKLWLSGDARTAAQAIGFKELIPYFEGKEELSVSLDRIRQATRHYAKRQLTWFRRDARIFWINQDKNEQSDKIIEKCLNIVAKSEIMCYNSK